MKCEMIMKCLFQHFFGNRKRNKQSAILNAVLYFIRQALWSIFLQIFFSNLLFGADCVFERIPVWDAINVSSTFVSLILGLPV